MDVEKIIEQIIQEWSMGNLGATAEAKARAALAVGMEAAAEEASGWAHNYNGTRDPEQAMQQAAQDRLATKISETFRAAAYQARKS